MRTMGYFRRYANPERVLGFHGNDAITNEAHAPVRLPLVSRRERRATGRNSLSENGSRQLR